MRLLRRSTLGVALAAFVYLAYACATGTESGREGFDDDAGAGKDADATKDVVVTRTNEDSGRSGGEDAAAGCKGKVVINELMTDGTSATEEFVELYNPGTCAVPLGGWTLGYRSASNGASVGGLKSFVVGTQIPAKGFLLFGGAGFTGKVDGTLDNGMAAAAGQVALLDETGKVVDSVAYGAVDGGAYAEKRPAPAPAEGASIARKSDGLDTDDNGADFVRAAAHTAGAPNQ